MYIEDFLEASMLGDGCLRKPKTNAFYRLTQIAAHKDYIDWVNSILLKVCKTSLYFYEKRADGKNASPWYVLDTTVNPIFTKFRKRWYPNGVKTVPQDIKLTPQKLAIWIMDDGSYNKPRKELKLCTHSFSFEDAELLKYRLYVDLNLTASIRGEYKKHTDTKIPVMYLLRQSTRDLPAIVSRYILTSFRYKIYPEV